MKQFFVRHPLLEQILKFGIVGSSAFVIDTVVFWVLINYIHINSYVAIALAFLVSLFYNYVLSTRWVFDPKRKQSMGTAAVFTVLSVIGLALTELIYGFVTKIIFAGICGLAVTNLLELSAKVISSGVVMVYNFITRKVFLEG